MYLYLQVYSDLLSCLAHYSHHDMPPPTSHSISTRNFKLPTTPCIVAQVELDDDVVTAVVHAREEIRAHKDVELDVSTNDDLQAIAIALGSKFIVCTEDFFLPLIMRAYMMSLNSMR